MGPSGIAGCAALTGALTLGAGGSLTAALKSAAFAFASAAVFTGVGEMLKPHVGTAGFLFVKAAVFGVVGGALSAAQGGEFLQGFAANAVGAFAGGASDGAFGPGGASPDIFAHTLIVAAAGCASASITGGKCADAAVIAAFASIYNAWGGALTGVAWGGNIGQGLGAFAAGVCAAFTGGTCAAALTVVCRRRQGCRHTGRSCCG